MLEQSQESNTVRQRLLKMRRLFNCNIPPTIVASMGRSGSTLVYNAIVDGIAGARFSYLGYFGRRLVGGEAWNLDLAILANGTVYKTHDFPYRVTSGDRTKAIFLYRRPSDTILSLYRCMERDGRGWIDAHFVHLHASGRFEDLLTRDVLRYEEQISSWLNADNVEVLGLRYETLWDHADLISEFLGVEIVLPSYLAPRQEADYDPQLVARVRDAYRSLDKVVAAMQDYFVSGPDRLPPRWSGLNQFWGGHVARAGT
jgi:hypothetical protein